ncbi:MAG: hypothetical protein WC942_09335 [Clostridia bacterium]|jgi:hypothetical protein
MRGNKSFYRTNEISREPTSCSTWLESFAETMALKEASGKTAVEVARNRQPSIFEMMSSIVSDQKPKFSSVEEAVVDYQKRTGLSNYLSKKVEASDNSLDALAQEIIQNSDVNDADIIDFPFIERVEGDDDEGDEIEEDEWGDVIELSDFFPDDDPTPGGPGRGEKGVLFELPTLEGLDQAAADDCVECSKKKV